MGCDPPPSGPDACESRSPVREDERRKLSITRGDTQAVVTHCRAHGRRYQDILESLTDTGLFDQSVALAGLPDLSTPPAHESVALAATGTDGRGGRNVVAPHLPHPGDLTGRILT